MPLSVLPHRDDLMRAAAGRIAQLAERAIAARGRFDWALAGGKTPEQLYGLLAGPPYAGRVDWARVHFFWSDERCVPPDHAESNYRMARQALLDRVRPPAEHVHRMRGEQPPLAEASRYQLELGGLAPGSPGTAPPRLDLILLGMGSDGHTASLFPGDEALDERERWVAAARMRGPGPARLTFTLPLINAARTVLFLVAGSDKAGTLAKVSPGASPRDTAAPGSTPLLPAQRVQPTDGELEWFVDAEAAALS
ncbi:MAG TPA: 6-phosphogluconolactonase [Polyangiaceae bacterium]|nr:6-phosphogluconolactonase [Polyangiaceae bacterium]